MKNFMSSNKKVSQKGQGLVEYALLILLVAVVIITVLILLSPNISNSLSKVNSSPALVGSPTPEGTPAPNKFTILSDMEQRINNYYKLHGSWPRTWGDYAYTDIGLNPSDWSDPQDGIYWGPHGSNIGLANKAGDNIQIYVNDLTGKKLHVLDTWNIWCVADTGQCYYHTIAPGNEVDISTLVTVQN